MPSFEIFVTMSIATVKARMLSSYRPLQNAASPLF